MPKKIVKINISITRKQIELETTQVLAHECRCGNGIFDWGCYVKVDNQWIPKSTVVGKTVIIK